LETKFVENYSNHWELIGELVWDVDVDPKPHGNSDVSVGLALDIIDTFL